MADSRIAKVHRDFKELVAETARDWTVKTGRRVTEIQVTEAMARAFAREGSMSVTIVCPPKPGPGPRPRPANPIFDAF